MAQWANNGQTLTNNFVGADTAVIVSQWNWGTVSVMILCPIIKGFTSLYSWATGYVIANPTTIVSVGGGGGQGRSQIGGKSEVFGG